MSVDALVKQIKGLPVEQRSELLDQAALVAQRRVPNMQLVIAGEGPERARLEHMIRHNDAESWITLVGHVPREGLLDLYRSAWLVSSASIAEGWGLTMTEAAACGVPAVATNISGHRCSVVQGVTGELTELSGLGDVMGNLLLDQNRRHDMGQAALARARTLTWDASALGVIKELHGQVLVRKQRKATRYETARYA